MVVDCKHSAPVIHYLKMAKEERSVNQISQALKIGNGQVNVALRVLIGKNQVVRRQLSREEHGIKTGKLPHVYKAVL